MYAQQSLSTNKEYPTECPRCGLELICSTIHYKSGLVAIFTCDCGKYSRRVKETKDFIKYVCLCYIQLKDLGVGINRH